MRYKNIGMSSKTFYGVTFEPGDVKDVEGYINASSFIRVDERTPVTSKKSEPAVKQTAAAKVESKPADSKVTEPKIAETKPSDAKKDTTTDGKN